jgi:hypothetical protein
MFFCGAFRSAARAEVMRQRVAAIEEREQQRRYRMDSLGQDATTTSGPDMGRFVSQLETKGFGGNSDNSSQPGDSSSRGQTGRQQQ